LRDLVIPAKAGIYSASLWKCAVVGLDSRFRGNDRWLEWFPIPNDPRTCRARKIPWAGVSHHPDPQVRRMSGIADFRLPIVEAENRNSKIETRLHWIAAASPASFEFLVSSFEDQQSAMRMSLEPMLNWLAEQVAEKSTACHSEPAILVGKRFLGMTREFPLFLTNHGWKLRIDRWDRIRQEHRGAIPGGAGRKGD